MFFLQYIFESMTFSGHIHRIHYNLLCDIFIDVKRLI